MIDRIPTRLHLKRPINVYKIKISMGNECESITTKVGDSSRVVLNADPNEGSELIRSTHKPDLNIERLFDASED